MATPLRSAPPPALEPAPAPSAATLAQGLTRLLDDLHEQLADDQLRALERLRLEPADLLALGAIGAAPGTSADPAAVRRLELRGLVEPAGRGRGHQPTAAGRLMLDELHEARRGSIQRFVEGLDRGQRLRLGGALHLLSSELGGEAVVGG